MVFVNTQVSLLIDELGSKYNSVLIENSHNVPEIIRSRPPVTFQVFSAEIQRKLTIYD